MELMIAGLLLGSVNCWLVTSSKFKLKWYEWTLLLLMAIPIVLAAYNSLDIEQIRRDEGSILWIGIIWGDYYRKLAAAIAAVLAVIGAVLAWLRQGKATTAAPINGQPQTDVAESQARPTPEDRSDDTVAESSPPERPRPETNDEAPTDAPGAETPKRSAVDEIKDLSKRIHRLQAQVGEIDNFARASHSKLTLQGDEQKLHNIGPTLAALMRVYNQLFRRMQAMEAGGVQPDQFILDMLPNVETELQGCGVSVIRPHPGDSIDLQVMNLIGHKPTPFWRRGNRVAQMEKCGYMLTLESGDYVLEKAEVVVYRDTADQANLEGDTNESSTDRN